MPTIRDTINDAVKSGATEDQIRQAIDMGIIRAVTTFLNRRGSIFQTCIAAGLLAETLDEAGKKDLVEKLRVFLDAWGKEAEDAVRK